MSMETKEELAYMQELNRKISCINEELRKACVYQDDAVAARMNNGCWTLVIFTGVHPESDSPFYTELPDGTINYFDRIASHYTSDDLGTNRKIEGELTEADIHGWY